MIYLLCSIPAVYVISGVISYLILFSYFQRECLLHGDKQRHFARRHKILAFFFSITGFMGLIQIIFLISNGHLIVRGMKFWVDERDFGDLYYYTLGLFGRVDNKYLLYINNSSDCEPKGSRKSKLSYTSIWED